MVKKMNKKNTLAQFKELRDRTQAGILDCRKALEVTNYDIEKAIVWLKENGITKAAKKGGAIAAEGVIAIEENDDNAILFEVNSQTDFVCKNEHFVKLVKNIGKILLENDFETIEQAQNLSNNEGQSINDLILEATAIIGEKIVFRRAIKINKVEDETIGTYLHNNLQIGAVALIIGGNKEIARNLAMHIAAMNPEYLDKSSIPEKQMEEIEQEVYNLPALANKPDNIRDKIAAGMINKKLSEMTLVNQEFIMEKISVENYLAKNNAKAIAMYRFEVAEGITKKSDDFAAEVAAQISSICED